MSKDIKLAPCPFCGGEVLEVGKIKPDVECIICRVCGATSPDTEPYTWQTRAEDTIKAWNTRHRPGEHDLDEYYKD